MSGLVRRYEIVATAAVVLSITLGAVPSALGTHVRSQHTSALPPSQTRHLDAAKFRGTLIGLQYETYFTPHNTQWKGKRETAVSSLQQGTEEAIPILGEYSSFDVKTLRTHEKWFGQLGINWLLLDWSNFLAMKPAWELHRGATHELEESTSLLFKTYSDLQKEGRHPPKLVLMLGLGAGSSADMKRVNEIVKWTTENFLDRPEYKNLWLYYHGKPLMTILYFPAHPCEDLTRVLAQTPLHATGWTIRWVASQLQDNHAERCGMWSWMDGSIRQIVTDRNGLPEETVVTPACFPLTAPPNGGWLSPLAVGKDHGAPYLESWKVAFESRPKFIQIHQWNEFSGQGKGDGAGPEHNIFGDEYSSELSDDIEPTMLDTCGYRGCGGWGYYYMNLTRALISLYRGHTPDITVMALSGPFQPAVVKADHLRLKWVVIGKKPTGYELQLDGKTIAHDLPGTSYVLNLAGSLTGRHRVTLIADGAHTYFDLDPRKMAKRSSKPLPVTSAIEFRYAPAQK